MIIRNKVLRTVFLKISFMVVLGSAFAAASRSTTEADLLTMRKALHDKLCDDACYSTPGATQAWLDDEDVVQLFCAYGSNRDSVKLALHDVTYYNRDASELVCNVNEIKAPWAAIVQTVGGTPSGRTDIYSNATKNALDKYNEIAEVWFDRGILKLLKCMIDANTPGVTSPFNQTDTQDGIRNAIAQLAKVCRAVLGDRGLLGSVRKYINRNDNREIFRTLPRKLQKDLNKKLAETRRNAHAAFQMVKTVYDLVDKIRIAKPLTVDVSIMKRALIAAADGTKAASVGFIVGPLGALVTASFGVAYGLVYDGGRFGDLFANMRKVEAQVCCLHAATSLVRVGMSRLTVLQEVLQKYAKAIQDQDTKLAAERVERARLKATAAKDEARRAKIEADEKVRREKEAAREALAAAQEEADRQAERDREAVEAAEAQAEQAAVEREAERLRVHEERQRREAAEDREQAERRDKEQARENEARERRAKKRARDRANQERNRAQEAEQRCEALSQRAEQAQRAARTNAFQKVKEVGQVYEMLKPHYDDLTMTQAKRLEADGLPAVMRAVMAAQGGNPLDLNEYRQGPQVLDDEGAAAQFMPPNANDADGEWEVVAAN